MSLPVIGAKISLISKSEIRFVGTLININHKESCISLQNVISYGTEGLIIIIRKNCSRHSTTKYYISSYYIQRF